MKLLPDGFSVEGREYRAANTAQLATFDHPTRAGRGITLILGSSAASLPRASSLPFYPDIAVVVVDGRPVQRRDLSRLGSTIGRGQELASPCNADAHRHFGFCLIRCFP